MKFSFDNSQNPTKKVSPLLLLIITICIKTTKFIICYIMLFLNYHKNISFLQMQKLIEINKQIWLIKLHNLYKFKLNKISLKKFYLSLIYHNLYLLNYYLNLIFLLSLEKTYISKIVLIEK